MKLSSKAKETGNVLVLTTLLVTLTLFLSLNISSQIIKSTKSISDTDSSSKARLIAESLAERLLIKPISVLEDYAQNDTCGDECTLEVLDENNLKSTASAVVSFYNSSSNQLTIDLTTQDFSEVNVASFTNSDSLDICWNENDSANAPAVVGHYFYGSDPINVESFAYNSASSTDTDNGLSFASPDKGYLSCFTVSTQNASKVLRLKAYYSDITVALISNTSQLFPPQGVLIEVDGRQGDIVKKVAVIKRKYDLDSDFDYVINSRSPYNDFTK